MSGPTLVIVSGPPGAGKTTLAKRLGAELDLPVLDRDDFKDTMFDTLGWSDRQWSQRVGRASWELLFMVADKVLSGGASVMLDSNFERIHAADRVCEIGKRHGAQIVEVHCSASVDVLARRFRERWRSGGRHPGHASEELSEETVFRATLAKRDHGPLGAGGVLVEVDTNDPERIDWDSVVARVRGAMDGPEDR